MLVALAEDPEVTRISAIRGDCQDLDAIEDLLECRTYSRVVFFVDETQPETVRENLFLPTLLALMCQKHRTHFTYVNVLQSENVLAQYTHTLFERLEHVLVLHFRTLSNDPHLPLFLDIVRRGYTGAFNMLNASADSAR